MAVGGRAGWAALLGAVACAPDAVAPQSAEPPVRPAAVSTATASTTVDAAPTPSASASPSRAAPPWRPVTQHGFSSLVGPSRVGALGARIAWVEQDAIRWDCRYRLSDTVNAVQHVHLYGDDTAFAWVSVGVQASLWMRWTAQAGRWTDVAGGGVAKRTTVLHASDSTSRLWVFRHEPLVQGGIDWAVLRLGERDERLRLQADPDGCVGKGVMFLDWVVGPADTATLLCERGVEQWHRKPGAKAWSHQFVALPASSTLQAAWASCGTAVARGRLARDGGDVDVIVPAKRRGTLVARLGQGKWKSASRLTDHVVSGHVSSFRGQWFATAHGTSGNCKTRLWRRAGNELKAQGAAVLGKAVRVLADAEGWPVVVTDAAILRWRRGAPQIERVPVGPVSDATMVGEDLWLSTSRWMAQRSYREVGSPKSDCWSDSAGAQ